MILTDGNGRPFEKPEPPSPDASIEEKIAFIRATHEYNDRVADCANVAFADQLRRSLAVDERSDA